MTAPLIKASVAIVAIVCWLGAIVHSNHLTGKTQQPVSSLSLAKEQVQRTPNSTAAWLFLADHYYNNDQISNSAKALNVAASLARNRPGPLRAVVLKFIQTGQYVSSVDAAKRLISIDLHSSIDIFAAYTTLFGMQKFVSDILPTKTVEYELSRVEVVSNIINSASTKANEATLNSLLRFWQLLPDQDKLSLTKVDAHLNLYRNLIRHKQLGYPILGEIASYNANSNWLSNPKSVSLDFVDESIAQPFCWRFVDFNLEPPQPNSSNLYRLKGNPSNNSYARCFIPINGKALTSLRVLTQWQMNPGKLSRQPRLSLRLVRLPSENTVKTNRDYLVHHGRSEQESFDDKFALDEQAVGLEIVFYPPIQKGSRQTKSLDFRVKAPVILVN